MKFRPVKSKPVLTSTGARRGWRRTVADALVLLSSLVVIGSCSQTTEPRIEPERPIDETIGPPPELVVNGSFETGDLTGWNVTNLADPFAPVAFWVVSPAGAGPYFGNSMPQDGLLAAWNGFDGCGPDQFTMYQDVAIPVSVPTTLSWMDRIQWNFRGAARTYEVQLRDPATDIVLATLHSFSFAGEEGDTGWLTHTSDLSPYAGTTIRLHFVEKIPADECYVGPGQFEIDAITTAVAPAGGGPASASLSEAETKETSDTIVIEAKTPDPEPESLAAVASEEPRIFEEVTLRAGIDFNHHHPRQVRFPAGAGVVVFDFNNDGFDDIYIGDSIGPNALYRNDRDGTFTDVALSAGIHDAGRANGGCAADYDNDGDQDLFITIYGGSRLYRNEADGTFADVTASSLSDYDKNFHRLYSSTGCAWGDYDRDGLLDLLVVRHISSEEPVMSKEGRIIDLAGGVTLYHNDGSGTFRDVTRLLGDNSAPTENLDPGRMGNVWGAGHQPIWVDFDNDGDQDIYVANDFGMHVQPNVLWRNDGLDEDGRWAFRDTSTGSGSDVRMYGMGLAVGDYDLDGFFDFYVTNLGDHVLLRNDGDGVSFTDTAEEAGVVIGKLGVKQRISWGTVFFDYDNDRDEDLYVVSGYLKLVGLTEVRDYEREQPNVLLRNSGDGTFENVSLISGADDPGIGRGGAFLDFDQDGCLDLFVGNLDGSPRLYRNECDYGNNWLVIKTVGTASNRDGIGARITVDADGVSMIREVAGGRSNMGQNMMAAHFGIGSAQAADSITITWPSGTVQTLTDVAANQRLTVVEP